MRTPQLIEKRRAAADRARHNLQKLTDSISEETLYGAVNALTRRMLQTGSAIEVLREVCESEEFEPFADFIVHSTIVTAMTACEKKYRVSENQDN